MQLNPGNYLFLPAKSLEVFISSCLSGQLAILACLSRVGAQPHAGEARVQLPVPGQGVPLPRTAHLTRSQHDLQDQAVPL